MDRQSIAELQVELDSIIEWFGSDDVDIDEAEAKYERGLELVRELKKRLQDKGNTVKKLKAQFKV